MPYTLLIATPIGRPASTHPPTLWAAQATSIIHMRRHAHRQSHNESTSERRFRQILYGLMEMETVVGAIAQIGELQVRNDDDFVDRLSRRYTTFVLVLFAILVSTKQYVGEPINCWVPAQFTDNHEEYANKICWVSNTYYLPFSEKIPETDTPKENRKIVYYQWVPMILLSQAVMFFLPCLFWRLLNQRSGLHIKAIIDAAIMCQRSASMGDNREKDVRYMVNHLDSYLGANSRIEITGFWARIRKSLAKRCFLICGKVHGNYLVMVYLLVKLLYILNAVGQLFMLDVFLGADYHMFGITVVTALLRGEDWRPTERFPRVTLCDFRVRSLGNTNQHTVQCVLPINLFNEKIYVFIWFWFVFVSMVTILNLFHWISKSFLRKSQVAYVKRHLRALGRINRETDIQASRFAQDYLRQDGVFALRLVAKNAGDLIAAELAAGLWDIYGRERRLLMDLPARPPPPALP